MRKRNTARIVLIDQEQRLLLMKFEPPSTEAPFWATVGGEIEPGESFEQALLRELYEETGLREADIHVRGEIWFGRGIIPLGGESFECHERFALVRVHDVSVDTSEMTALERQVIKELRWWSAEELSHCGEQVFPPELPTLFSALLSDGPPVHPIEIEL